MSERVIALELAIKHLAVAPEAAEVSAVIAVAEKFATFLMGSTSAPSTPAKRGGKKDAAPTEPLAETVQTTEPDTAKPAKPEPTAEAEPTVTEDDVRDIIKKVAGNPAIGPVPVRAALGKCVNPDTGKPATTISTLHASHYAQVATELRAVLEKATKDAKAA